MGGTIVETNHTLFTAELQILNTVSPVRIEGSVTPNTLTPDLIPGLGVDPGSQDDLLSISLGQEHILPSLMAGAEA
jgi:hypothetical protein